MDHLTSWHITVDLFERDESTVAHVVLDTGTRKLSAHGRTKPVGSRGFVPEIADEFAAGSALVDLGTQLLLIATEDSTPRAEPVTHASSRPQPVE